MNSLLSLTLSLGLASGVSANGVLLSEEALDAGPEAVQLELLEVAFEAASSLPIDPHIKNRARAQEEVVSGCIALGHADVALEYANAIPNWRKGACFADLAYFHAREGELGRVEALLERADVVASTDEAAIKQAWRRDRIRAKIAKTYSHLGRTAEAARFLQGLTASETSEVAVVEARSTTAEALEARLAELDDIVATGDFEGTQVTLLATLELHDVFYADEERRDLLEERVVEYASQAPLLTIMDARILLARNALAHDDVETALRLHAEAVDLFESYRWDAEHGIPVRARLAVLEGDCGRLEPAREELAAAIAEFEENRKLILGTQHANTLRAVAEAYADLGESEAALELYREVVAVGAVNTNARPRVADLVRTCVSMAVHGVTPDEALMKEVRSIRDSLVRPE